MVTEEEIAELLKTPEGRQILQSMWDATRGLPPEQIGASPDIPGATRGLPPKLSGINTEEENKLSRMGMQELLMRQW